MREAHPPEFDFAFHLDRQGEIAFALGNAKLSLAVDAAYELQYQLAEMLAFVESFEDRETSASPPREHRPSNLIPFETHRRKKP